jgi:tripartite-type tricarboxylate transporter receptor subunit TctC
LNEPNVKKRLIDLGFQIEGSSPQELGVYLHQEFQRTGDLIRAANIKLQ